MIIGMILDKPFPPDSRVENEALSLINDGHKVVLFCLHYGNQKESEEVNGIHVRRYKSNKITFKLSALAYTFPFYHQLLRPKIKHFIDQNKIEAVHIHDMQVAKSIFDLNLKLPVILDLHENRPEIMKSYGHVKSLKGRMLINPQKWEKNQEKLIAKADHVIVVTEEAKKEALGYNSKREEDITVVPNTIHPSIYNKYETDNAIVDKFKDGFNVLYLGDTALRRGTDTAIHTVNILKDSIKNIRLILVGNNRVEDHVLFDLVKELKLEKFVSFEGWRDVSMFPSYVLASDVCISPLKRNLHHDTTFANKLFQYMAMGRSVVVSDSTAQAKVVTDEKCGLIHKAENPESLAKQLLYLYQNAEIAKSYAANGQKAVEERWNWNITSQSLLKLYRNLADN